MCAPNADVFLVRLTRYGRFFKSSITSLRYVYLATLHVDGSSLPKVAIDTPNGREKGSTPTPSPNTPRVVATPIRIKIMKGNVKMASVKKFTDRAVVNQLRHIERTIKIPQNKDIDISKLHYDYFVSPEREMSSYSYYKARKEELYVYNRKDVVTMAGWVVTAPKDLAKEEEVVFFEVTYSFLEERYGKENVVSAVVHGDEEGQPHLHFCFIPVVPDKKHGGEKICANDILNRRELSDFHPALQKYLKEKGINANVMTGVTRAQGGNRTVRQMKQERERIHQQNRERGRWG